MSHLLISLLFAIVELILLIIVIIGIRRDKFLLDWAESIICNGKPMSHCTQEEWDGIVSRWRDAKHGVKPAKPEPETEPTS